MPKTGQPHVHEAGQPKKCRHEQPPIDREDPVLINQSPIYKRIYSLPQTNMASEWTRVHTGVFWSHYEGRKEECLVKLFIHAK